MPASPAEEPVRKKTRYHHGDLRAQLVTAMRLLVERDGPDGFSIAEACRAAGVSTAAPYRHFRDRQDMLAAVCMEGLRRLREAMVAAGTAFPAGSAERIAAMGHAYVAFATTEPGVFRLMFGMTEGHEKNEEIICEGQRALETLLAEIAHNLGRAEVDEDVLRRGFALWSFVHGIAFLRIDGKVDAMNLGLDIDQLVAETTRRIVGD